MFWVLLRRLWSGWEQTLLIVKPETVITWHRQGFKLIWRTFINNHSKQVWACDFLTQYTAFFAGVYVFVIMEVDSRRIVHTNVTTNPTLSWVKQQIREAMSDRQCPRFLVHDNDGIFGKFGKPVKVERDGKTRSYRCQLDRWLDEVMEIRGLPIQYGAPNASPHVERFMRTLRCTQHDYRLAA